MDEELRYLRTLPESSVIQPATRTRPQLLPFEQVNPRDFERLCLRLADSEADVEHAQLYGVPGQRQGGIDVYARRRDGSYVVYQARRVETITPGAIKDVVDDFLAGKWADRASSVVLCTRASLERTELADAVEAGNERLQALGKSFVAWDQARLSTKLKDRPDLVLDFFDRGWLEAFCPEAAPSLGSRLGADEMRELRQQLARLYENVFERRDTAVSLELASGGAWARFVVPDVIDRRNLPDLPPPVRERGAPQDETTTGTPGPGGSRSVEQRVALDQWLLAVPQHVLTAEAGGGKSSVLQFVALDLLADSPRLGELMARFDSHLPVWLPFGFWVERVRRGDPSSFTETVRAWLNSYDEERLWPLVERGLDDGRLMLLIDGLDESGDIAAAERALDHLQVFVHQRDLPLIASGRTLAIEELGPLPREWPQGAIALLTPRQQRNVVRALGDGVEGEAFFRAIELSGDLRSLAATPLLLILLLWLHRQALELPQDRFGAYREVVDYILEKHPRRREHKERVPLQDVDVRAALAAVAYDMQRAGMLVLEQQKARATVAEHLSDATYGLAFSAAEARQMATQVIDDARGRLGLLVDVGDDGVSFLHRSLQEHLAASHLAARPLEAQADAVHTHGVDASWREVVLNLLALAAGSAPADALVAAISDGKTSVERWQLEPLLAEVAVGPFPISRGLRHELLERAADVVETAPAASAREETLLRLVQGLDVSPDLQAHLQTWLPALKSRRGGLLDAMANWPPEPETDHMVWRGLFDEETANARGAARAYAKRYGTDDAAEERLIDALSGPLEPQTRAAMLEALTAGWPQNARIPAFMTAAHESIDPDLRLVAHTWRIQRGEQTESDLDDLLLLGSQRIGVDFDRKGVIPYLIIEGWPRSERVRDLALRTSQRINSSRELEFDIALTLLLIGYGGDPQVIEYCRQEIERDDHPFLMLHFDAWKFLAINFRDEPTLVAAIDDWIPKQQFREPDISYAALLGRTEVAKATLIRKLNGSSFPHWLVSALLEGWGMDEPEVAEALTAAAIGEADLAGRIAHFLPRILRDREHLTERLLTLVGDESNPRPGLAVDALGRLGANASEVVGRALGRKESQWFDHELWYALIGSFSSDPRVRDLAFRCFDGDWYSPDAVAASYGDDPELRGFVRQHAAPLPSEMRTRVAERLRDGAGPAELTVRLLEWFVDEEDPNASSTEAQAWIRRMQESGGSADHAVEQLEKSIVALGPTYEKRRQTALTALIELGRFDVFATARNPQKPEEFADVSLTDHLRPNLVLADTVVKQWNELESSVGDLVGRLSKYSDQHTTWDVLALVAEQSEEVRERAVRYIEDGGRISANLLHLYARVHPRSDRLLALCLAALGDKVQDQSPTRDLIVAAAEIIGANFRGDADALAAVQAAALPLTSRLMVLAEGWPTNEDLQTLLEEARSRKLQGPWEAVIRVRLAVGDSREVVDGIRALIKDIEQDPRFADRPLAAITRRFQNDPGLVTQVEALIADNPQPSEIASFPRLLALAGVLNSEGREITRILAERGFKGDLATVVGLDLVAGRRRPVAFALLDALSGTPI